MTSRVSRTVSHAPFLPLSHSSDFASALQMLVAQFWNAAEAEGRVADEISIVAFLEYVFGALAFELGRIDGVARLHGVGRDQMMALLAKAYSGGKQATLEHHHRDSRGCMCEASLLLKKELELN